MPGRRPVEFRVDADRFEADWYRSAYPVAQASGTATALGHFIEAGAGEGLRPNRDFDPDWYLSRYPRVAGRIAAGRLAGAFHDYLLRAEQGVPRRAAPATAVIAAALPGVQPDLIAILARLTDRAPGWEFWILAPPGSLPAERFGPHVRLVASGAELPAIDLWLGLRDGDAVDDAGTSVVLRSLAAGSTSGTEAADLDRILEQLRARLLADCPIIPRARRDSGPVHVDPARTAALEVSLRALPGRAAGPGAVVRGSGRILAELAAGAAVVNLAGAGALWIDLAAGLSVNLSSRRRTVEPVDLIVCGPGDRAAWMRSLRAIPGPPPRGALTLVAPPAGLDIPDTADVRQTRAEALAESDRPALLVPPGTALLPQAAAQAAACIEAGIDFARSAPAMRHPDGHLAVAGPGALDLDPDHSRRWRRAAVTLLSGGARQRIGRRVRADAPAFPDAIAPVAEVDAALWPARFAALPALAPGGLRLDCRGDGTVLGRLRLRGADLVAGGTVLIVGTTKGVLAEPCTVRAAWHRPRAADVPLGQLTLPASAPFSWPIRLPSALPAGTLTIAPLGRWITAHPSADPRPVLFRLEAVRYRPPVDGSSSPIASSRSR